MQNHFYHIWGTQDNGSSGGPSATDERELAINTDKTLFADGHQSAMIQNTTISSMPKRNKEACTV